MLLFHTKSCIPPDRKVKDKLNLYSFNKIKDGFDKCFYLWELSKLFNSLRPVSDNIHYEKFNFFKSA